MSTFKSPELHLCGRLLTVTDLEKPQQSSFYVKCEVLVGEKWQTLSGNSKFQTFESETSNTKITPLQHPFNIHYVAESMRGWPRMLLEVWKVDQYGRHNLHGYGTLAVPFKSGEYPCISVYCWRPTGSWYDQFIGANSELQYPGIAISSLSRYGLSTLTTCEVKIEINLICRGWHLHGIKRQ